MKLISRDASLNIAQDAPNPPPASGWFARAGGSSGGGGGARGSSGSSGAGRGGSGGTSSGGSTALRGGSSTQAGRSVYRSGQLSASQRQGIWNQGAPRYGSNRPTNGSPAPVYGFWPLTWYTDVPEGGEATNATRPGGPLLSAALQAPDKTPETYLIYGDSQSVEDLLPTLMEACSAHNSSSPFDAQANTTLQNYRDESFALLGVNAGQADANQSFVACLNDTIGNNLLVSRGFNAALPSATACLVAVLVALGRMWVNELGRP